MPLPIITSYLLAGLAVIAVLYYHLLSAVLSGLAVYVLTGKLAKHLPSSWGRKTKGVALVGIFLMVALAVFGVAMGLWVFFEGDGMHSLLDAAGQGLDSLKQNLPPYLANRVPSSVEQLRGEMAKVLREHGKNITHVGMSGARTFVHILFGMVIGGIAVMHRIEHKENPPLLAAGLSNRLRSLANAFDRVVFAQVKISALNTVLTAIYLAGILPLFGEHMPMTTLLILLTFLAGLLPVVGNLISNSVIVLVSLGVSPGVAAGSSAFLLLVHKLEYFTNAKIVGGHVNASSWELLSAMVFMEAVFGMAGMVAAPIIYAWLKSELMELKLV